MRNGLISLKIAKCPYVSAASKTLADRSLSRLAPTSVSPEGKPRVLVPDGVFQRGAALHKEYIVCSFLGKLPDYGPIQSVLNYMWGKGSKLEIHLQPLKRSALVRVPNDYIRGKILEKKLWYVETSMFYASQWGDDSTASYPEITSIPLWAHLHGVPFDLRTKEGLSHAAALVGEPIETDDYTKNVSSLNVAHVKVEANLLKPMSSSGELVRESGEIIPVDIEYPWTPPSCSHCYRIGSISKICIYPLAVPPAVPAQSSNDASVTTEISLKGYSPHAVIKDHQVHSEPVLQETSIQDKIVDHPLDPNPTIDSQTALDLITYSVPMLPPQVPPSSSTPLPVLPSHTELPITPFDPSNLSSPHLKAPSSPISPTVPLVFSSQPSSASVVVSLAATRAPYSTSYIAIKQAAFFKSPPVSLPPLFHGHLLTLLDCHL